MPKVSPEHTAARRAQILAGARRAFARYGYEGATVTRLEEETGLSRGAIFHYFRDKKELFVALAAEVNEHYVELMRTGGMADAIHELAAESREWLAVLIETEVRLHHDEDFVRRVDKATSHVWPPMLTWLQEQQERGELRSDVDPLDLGRFATIVINGFALRVAGGDETNAESVVRLLERRARPSQVASPRACAARPSSSSAPDATSAGRSRAPRSSALRVVAVDRNAAALGLTVADVGEVVDFSDVAERDRGRAGATPSTAC